MGYSIRIKRADGGDAVLPEKHDIAGQLDGGCVRDSLPVLVKAISALGDARPDDDYWKATDGNAKEALVKLNALADLALRAFPDERLTWEID